MVPQGKSIGDMLTEQPKIVKEVMQEAAQAMQEADSTSQ
jgi:hypothetical protein